MTRKIIGDLLDETFIAIHMGGKLKDQDWGESNWKKLIISLNVILSKKNIGLLIVGSEFDYKRGNKISKLWNKEVINACGKLTARETAAAIKNSVCFIGHDSGPIHLAECMNVICIGIFGHLFPPKLFHPYGEKHYIIHNSENIKDIKSKEIVKIIISIFKDQGL